MERLRYKIYILISLLCLFLDVTSITKYDFNVCRIDFCTQKQRACVDDQGDCMKAFAQTRKCFNGCTSQQELETYNICWANCKQSQTLETNTLYGQVGQCYQQLCYLMEQSIMKIGMIVFICFVTIMMM